jgi:hypothetical protein
VAQIGKLLEDDLGRFLQISSSLFPLLVDLFQRAKQTPDRLLLQTILRDLLPSASPDQGQTTFVSAMRSGSGLAIRTVSVITSDPVNCLPSYGVGTMGTNENIAPSPCSKL